MHRLELSVIAALFFLGWNKALDIVENPDPAIRVQERADLDWWSRESGPRLRRGRRCDTEEMAICLWE